MSENTSTPQEDEHHRSPVKVVDSYPSRQSHASSADLSNENNLHAEISQKLDSREISPPDITTNQNDVGSPVGGDEEQYEYASFIRDPSNPDDIPGNQDQTDSDEEDEEESSTSYSDEKRRIISTELRARELENRETEETLERLENILANHPEDFETLYKKGCVLMILDRIREAEQCFEKVINSFTETDIGHDFNLLQYNASCFLAECYLKQQDTSRAQEMFSKLAKAFPTRWKAFVGLGMCFDATSQFQEAIKQYQIAAKIIPTNTDIPRLIATCEKCIGDSFLSRKAYTEAINQYTRAISINKKNVMFYCKRGVAYYMSGDETKAYLDFAWATHLYHTKMCDVIFAIDNTEKEAVHVEKIILEYIRHG